VTQSLWIIFCILCVHICRLQIINYSFTNDVPRICHPRGWCTRTHLAFFFLSEIGRMQPYLACRTYPTTTLPYLILPIHNAFPVLPCSCKKHLNFVLWNFNVGKKEVNKIIKYIKMVSIFIYTAIYIGILLLNLYLFSFFFFISKIKFKYPFISIIILIWTNHLFKFIVL